MEQKNRFLSPCLPLGLIAGAAVGVLVWIFTGSVFAVSIGGGLGMLAGVVIGAPLDSRHSDS